MPIKNQSFVAYFYAFDTANNVAKTGDAGNITMYVDGDGGTPGATSNSVAEVDATNMPGEYRVTLTSDEANFDSFSLAGKSSTSDIVVYPMHYTTERGNIATAQSDLDTITGTDGTTLATSQGNYAPTKGTDTIDTALTRDAAIKRINSIINNASVATDGGSTTEFVFTDNDGAALITHTVNNTTGTRTTS